MDNGTNGRWTMRAGVVATLAVAGVLGTCLPANAMPSSPASPPAINFTVQVVSASITAWDVWNMFR